MKRLFTVALTLGAVIPIWSQTSSRLAFEVASIKQEDVTLPNRVTGGACHGSEATGPVGIPGMTVAMGRCRYVGAKVKQLINNAYGGIALDRIVGGPDWIESLPFSIDAKAEDSLAPTRPQLMEMMRTLLEDRFKLKFHRETKEVDGYTLVVGRNGIKLTESAAPRGSVVNSSGNIKGSMTLASLAGSLRGAVGSPVEDGTGLTARYDIDLKWSPDLPAGASVASDPTGPSIFTAIQELGLRLEPKKTTIELFVIDSVEKPVSN